MPTSRSAVCWIGPEGGWAEEEVAGAARAGLAPASLGDTILRAETAAMIATYVVAHGLPLP